MFTHSFLGAGQEAAQAKAVELVGRDSWQRGWRAELGVADPNGDVIVKVHAPETLRETT